MASALSRRFKILRQFSAFLLTGTAAALVWANVDPESYRGFVEGALLPAEHWLAYLLTHGRTAFSFHFIVNDIFMALFFGIAGKEVAESFLPGGSLSSPRKAALPLIATMGGVFGPIAVFFALIAAFGIGGDVDKAAWAVPTATDIAYCWLFARLIFGAAHPAVTFLLVLAVLDDLIGMMIIAVYYTPEVHPEWLLLLVAALALCEGMRRFGVKSFWPYVLVAGPMSWFALHNTGVHAALALVPIIPFMPHARRDAGLFGNPNTGDTMNRFEHFFAPIVDVGLLGFGLANAGVALTAASFGGTVTWTIFLALLVGKTFGIFGFAWLGTRFGFSLPQPMTLPQVLVLGCVAGIGFTVALFVTTVALGLSAAQGWELPPGAADMLKLGALLSFAAGPLAWLMAKALRVQKIEPAA